MSRKKMTRAFYDAALVEVETLYSRRGVYLRGRQQHREGVLYISDGQLPGLIRQLGKHMACRQLEVDRIRQAFAAAQDAQP